MLAGLALAPLACVQPWHAEGVSPAASPSVIAGPGSPRARCPAAPPQAQALVPDEPCPGYLLVEGSRGAALYDAHDQETHRGPLEPTLAGCVEASACRFRVLRIGPDLWVAVEVVSREREGPAGEAFGLAQASGELAFVDLWEGSEEVRPVHESIEGPWYALRPVQCESGVGLRAFPRLPGLTEEQAPSSLRAREGRYELRDGVLTRVAPLETTCSRRLAMFAP